MEIAVCAFKVCANQRVCSYVDAFSLTANEEVIVYPDVITQMDF